MQGNWHCKRSRLSRLLKFLQPLRKTNTLYASDDNELNRLISEGSSEAKILNTKLDTELFE